MKTRITVIVFLLFFLTCRSQSMAQDTNLVLNPSFENYSTCPPGVGFLDYAQNWFNPTRSSPDYFNVCSPQIPNGSSHVPNNQIGSQFAHLGLAYGGFAVDLNPWGSFREYIAGNLSQPLSSGVNYYFEMFVSLGDSSTHSVNKLAVYFSNSNPSVFIDTNGNNNVGCLLYHPQIVWDTVVSDTVNWVKLSGNFIATGGESFFVIGNFLPNDSLTIDTINYNVTLGGIAYYYVDDIRLCHCDSLSDTSQHPVYPTFSIYPNPSRGNFLLTGNFPLNSQLHIYNLIGQEVNEPITLPEGNNQVPITLNLAQGIYIYRVQSGKDILHEDKLILVR